MEVFHDNIWGTVCDDDWDNMDARVVCSSLGFVGGTAVTYTKFGEGTGQIWLDDVDCGEHYANLEECRHSGWGVHNCGHHEDAGVECGGQFKYCRMPI